MKTWDQAFLQTWLAKDSHVRVVDDWVCNTLAAHRGVSEEGARTVAPWNVRTLVEGVRAFGTAQEWLWCVSAIAIMQELIFCAADGGIDPAGIATDRDLRLQIEALRALRNVVFHPALHVEKGGSPPPMARVIDLLSGDDDPDVVQLAKPLSKEWATFAAKPVATYALRKLNAAGDLFITRMRLLPKVDRR